MNRISLRDGTFSGQGDSMEMVIINASPVARAFFDNTFDVNNTVAPTCWSDNTQRPDPGVPELQRQASRCMDCKQNIRGSSGYGRACRFLQRLAIVKLDDLEKIYQLQLPATSIFGKTVEGHMPLQEYVRHLQRYNTTAISVATKMYFDKKSSVPKLFFKPLSGLDKEQSKIVEGNCN